MKLAGGGHHVYAPDDGGGVSGELAAAVIYVDGTTGDDAHPGTAALPLQTLTEAESRVAKRVGAFGVTIRVVDSNPQDWPTFRERTYDGPLIVYAEQVTERLASTAAVAGSSRLQLITAGGLGVDTYRGYAIEVLTGAAAGDRRIIRDHDDTTLVPAIAFSSAIAAGDTFRIISPAVAAQSPGKSYLVLQEGKGHKLPLEDAFGWHGYVPGLVVVGFSFGNLQLVTRDHIRCYGCESSGSYFEGEGSWLIGWSGNEREDATGQPATDALYLDSTLNHYSWSGWGWHSTSFAIVESEWHALGIVTGAALWAYNCSAVAQGGSIKSAGAYCALASTTTNDAGRGTKLIVTGKSLFPDIHFKITSTGAAPPLRAWGTDAVLEVCQTDCDAGANQCILCTEGGEVRVETAVTCVTTGLQGAVVQRGGRVSFPGGALTITVGATGNELEVGQTPTAGTVASLAAVGAYLAEADGSVVQRWVS